MTRPFLLAALLCLLPLHGQAQSFNEVAKSDIRGLRYGFAVGLHHSGDISTLDAFGTLGPETDEALTPEHVFAFPGLTRLFLGALTQALADVDALDLDAPISTYLPLLTPELGKIRARQLLNHTAGLDDAQLLEDQTWPDAMDDLNDRAMFTEPGRIFSPSRYSLPLLQRVIEEIVGAPLDELAHQAIIDPLGMTRSTFDLETAQEWGVVRGVGPGTDETNPYRMIDPEAEFDGLPVLFTTAPDVIRFAVAWASGGIRGTPPWSNEMDADTIGITGEPRGRSGFVFDADDGHLRATHRSRGLGVGASLYVFPESQWVVFTWGIGSTPTRATGFVLDRVEASLGPGTLSVDEALERSLELQGLSKFVDEPLPGVPEAEPYDPPPHPLGWAGTYLNGEYKIELKDGPEGLIYFTGDADLPVSSGRNGRFVAEREDGRVRISFGLEIDRDGRRYVRLRNKAFLHTDDRGRRRP